MKQYIKESSKGKFLYIMYSYNNEYGIFKSFKKL